MLNDPTWSGIADELYDCYRDGRQVELLTRRYPAIEQEDAYRIQERLISRFEKDGSPVKGYKIGLTSKPMQEMAGTNEPDFSAIPGEMFIPEGSDVPAGRFVTPMAEIELAFVLKKPLRGPGLTVDDIVGAVDYVVPAIEVVDFRVAMAPGMDVRDTIADLAAVGGVVLGDTKMSIDAIDVGDVDGDLIINGEVRESGNSSAVLGNPLNAVVWLANKMGGFGVGFQAGDVVLSGSFIRVVPVAPGDRVVASFGKGLGEVSLNFARGEDHV